MFNYIANANNLCIQDFKTDMIWIGEGSISFRSVNK